MIHLLNKLKGTTTIIKQTPNFFLQRVIIWKIKRNRQCLGVEERADKQHRWASTILLSSIAKSKHFKTMNQAPEKSLNLLKIHEMWKIAYFSNDCIIVSSHALPNCLSVVLLQTFLLHWLISTISERIAEDWKVWRPYKTCGWPVWQL